MDNTIYQSVAFLRSFLWFCWIIWGCLFTANQTQAQHSNVKFEHLTTKKGLSQSRIQCILQDRRGFMWFGTWDGLNKYDGYTFTVYRNDPNDSSTISSSRIVGIVEDEQGYLWLATLDRGLNRLDKNTGTFSRYYHNTSQVNSIGSNNLRCLYQDSKGNLWIGTQDAGLDHWDRQSRTFRHYKHNPTDPNSLSNNDVTSVMEDSQGNIWIGTSSGGLNLFNQSKNRFILYNHDPANSSSLSNNYVRCIFKDRKENIWIGTSGGGLNRWDPKSQSFVYYTHNSSNQNSLSNNIVMAISEDAEGRLWIGTEIGGLTVFDYAQNRFERYRPVGYDPSSLNSASIYSVYRDIHQNMWVGTFSGGLNVYNKYRKKFSSYQNNSSEKNGLNDNYVAAIAEDHQNQIWIGTNGGGLNRFEPKTGTFTYYKENPLDPNSLSGNFVTDLIIDRKDNLWVSAWEAGVTRINPARTIFTRYRRDPHNSNSISSEKIVVLHEDKEGNTWMGAHRGGLTFFDKKKNTFTHYRHNPADSSSLSHNDVRSILEDSRNNLWLGTEGGGLNRFDREKNQFIHFMADSKDTGAISNNFINSIFEDSKGNLWLATGSGLNRYDYARNRFNVFLEKDGLPGNTVHSIQEDGQGNLWLGTSNGLSRFDPLKNTFRNYSIEDGLQSNEFTIASLQARNGMLYFGSPDGFTVFHPDSIRENPIIPPVYITNFQVFNRDVLPGGKDDFVKGNLKAGGEIILSYRESVFSFEFAALNFTAPEKNQYAYQMEGFDKQWNHVGNKRMATYTNLDPGEYTFRVKASNNDGVWNEVGTAIKVTITPPFWATWWFKMAGILFLLSSAGAFYWVRVNAIQAQKKHLQYQNEELKKINTELDRFVYRASHDLRAPLTSILGLINITKTESSEISKGQYLGLMEKSVQKLDTFIQSIINYSKNARTEVVSKQIDFESLIWETFEDLKYMEGAEQVEKQLQIRGNALFFSDPFRLKIIFSNLISNAIRYRNSRVASFIRIQVDTSANRAQINIEDNGCGIAADSLDKIFDMFYRASQSNVGSGLGLYIVKEVITTMKGSIVVQSQMGKGTTFKVELPSLPPMAQENSSNGQLQESASGLSGLQ